MKKLTKQLFGLALMIPATLVAGVIKPYNHDRDYKFITEINQTLKHEFPDVDVVADLDSNPLKVIKAHFLGPKNPTQSNKIRF